MLILKQFVRFATVGIINTGLDFILFNLLIWLTGIYKGGWLGLLNFIAFSLATINSYFLNKFWTFKNPAPFSKTINSKKQFLYHNSNSHISQRDIQKGAGVKFFLISLAGCAINTGIVYFIATFIPPFFGVSQLL